MNNLQKHLLVSRNKPFHKNEEFLCLSGDGHGSYTESFGNVTCPRCLAIIKLEDEGHTRRDARNIVII